MMLSLLFAVFFFLEGRQVEAQEALAVPIFPVLYAAEEKEFRWNPAWPGELPPDAFIAKGAIAVLRVESEGWAYQLSRDRHGRTVELPLIGTGGAVSLVRGSDGFVESLSLPRGPAFRVIERDNGFPRLLEGEDGTWVRLDTAGEFLSESQYDGKGVIVAFTEYTLRAGRLYGAVERDVDGHPTGILVLHRDGNGLVTERESNGIRLAVIYDGLGRPVLLESQGGKMGRSFQWDERGLLVRLRRSDISGLTEELRYEYSFDHAGNWIERREILMVPLFGVMIPETNAIVTRKIEYF